MSITYKRPRARSIGVTAVGILTIFSALALFYLAFTILIISALMGPSAWGSSFFYVLGFGVILLVDARAILRGLRFGWHFSVVVWILMLVFLCALYYSWGLFGRFGVYFIGGYPDFESIGFNFLLASPFLTHLAACYISRRGM